MRAFHLNRSIKVAFIYYFVSLACHQVHAQSFYFGADLSYVHEMEDCGATYSVAGTAEDPYKIFSARGTNLVRLRLWHTPSWYDALNQGHRYSDFQDVRQSIIRAKAEGMKVLLDYHLSDTWADPGHQVVPVAWDPVVDDLEILQDSLYNYIYSTLANLAVENLLPELVQIGNETNKGILQSQQSNDAGWSLDWSRNSALFITAIDAVRDIELVFGIPIIVALHVAGPDDAGWLMKGFWDHGVRDFDIIGISYYYQFHSDLFDDVGNTITAMRNTYPGKEVMIFETAYQWTNGSADGAGNILSTGYPGYTPPSRARQKQWMIDLAQEVIDHVGTGVIYWEPAWVSTGCWTQFGHGSHWENATFFDFSDEVIEDGGIGWMTHQYNFPTSVSEQIDFSCQIKVFRAGNEIIIQRNDDSFLNERLTIELNTIEGIVVSVENFDPAWENNIVRISLPVTIPGFYLFTVVTKNHLPISKIIIL